MAFCICSLMARFFCINDTQRYCLERIRRLCKRRLKISGMFLIKSLFLGLNVAKAPLFCCFSFSYTFCQTIYFGYPKNIYIYIFIYIYMYIYVYIYMLIKSLATRTWHSRVVGFRHPTQRSVLLIRTFVTKPRLLTKYASG